MCHQCYVVLVCGCLQEEKKQRDAEAKRKRLEEAERKRQAMLEAQQKANAPVKANFVISKKDPAQLQQAAGPALDKVSY